MIENNFYTIFKNGSKTYFHSSMFFPREVKKDVFVLYSFLRTADDFVDKSPQKKYEFFKFKKNYFLAMKTGSCGDKIIDSFVELSKRKKFDSKWTKAFLKSMELDLSKKEYNTIKETERYVYGSAEVVGLFMAKILSLPKKSYPFAKKLGKAMQYLNFIRDIDEDTNSNRIYFPLSDFKKSGLRHLDYENAKNNPIEYKEFIQLQLGHYFKWQKEAEKGFKYIPKKYLIQVKTASDMYKWTAKKIQRDPYIVFKKKVKPRIPIIFLTTIRNSLVLKENKYC